MKETKYTECNKLTVTPQREVTPGVSSTQVFVGFSPILYPLGILEATFIQENKCQRSQQDAPTLRWPGSPLNFPKDCHSQG